MKGTATEKLFIHNYTVGSVNETTNISYYQLCSRIVARDLSGYRGERSAERARKREQRERERRGERKKRTSFDFVRTKPDSLIERFLLTRL